MNEPLTFTFLGTGTSGGVPSLGCSCAVCRSHDPHDHRLRSAALLEHGDTRILIDCGPDIRQQLMPVDFRPLTAVLLTHVHYDHVGGLDDLRPFSTFGDINIYADETTVGGIHRAMPYCFTEHLYPGVPRLNVHTLEPHKTFRVGDIDVLPLRVMHGKMPIMAYRFGSLAYITDMKTISPDEIPYASGTDLLIVNALRFTKDHHSHLLVDEALDFSRKVSAPLTLLIHSCHDIGLHEEVNRRLPSNVRLAYDGEVFV